MASEASDKRRARALAGLLVVTGTAHFAIPRGFDKIVPRRLPGPARTWTNISGAAELVTAAAIALPRTRRTGGLLAAALFAAVFPANVQMAVDWKDRSTAHKAIAYGRLPIQAPLIAWALRVRSRA